METNAVEVRQVVKTFGSIRALDGVTLAVHSGEIYGLLGPNGSGKTTLIRMLVGLLAPDSGSLSVLGVAMPDIGVLARIGYMTQQAALYPDLSVEENVRFFASLNAVEANVAEALRVVELDDRRDSVVADLSGGMRTRCSLACAIVHHPALLLLDEPTVGVDPQLRMQLWDYLHEMAKEGTTVVVSSHVMDEAERCDRLGLIRLGKLLAEGSSAQLQEMAGAKRLEDAFLTLSAAREEVRS